jgi:hypothetical protein
LEKLLPLPWSGSGEPAAFQAVMSGAAYGMLGRITTPFFCSFLSAEAIGLLALGTKANMPMSQLPSLEFSGLHWYSADNPCVFSSSLSSLFWCLPAPHSPMHSII